MSDARALANQKLYHAKILTTAWRVALVQEEIARSVLEQAYGPAVCQHLAEAYGWFLIEVAQPADMPATPPVGCADLPPVAQGRQIPPEILEFQQLEREGWLAYILNPDKSTRYGSGHGRDGTSQNLATQSEHIFGPDEAQQWHGQLNRLFERMSDSLEEY